MPVPEKPIDQMTVPEYQEMRRKRKMRMNQMIGFTVLALLLLIWLVSSLQQ
jgi:hypothetical protein